MGVFKGVFWYVPSDKRLITVKTACDEKGNTDQDVIYSSKSGENFNHKAEWSKIKKSVTNGYPYNFYPRGRVEVKDSKVTVFFNPSLDTNDIRDLILKEFGLEGSKLPIRTVADGSKHYWCLIESHQ